MNALHIPHDFAQKDAVYLNYAATSFPKSKFAVESFLKASFTLPTGTRQSQSSDMNGFRLRVGKILHIPEKYVFFTHSATLGLNQVIKGFIKELDCLAIDNRCHNAVVRPWLSLNKHCRCILAHIYDTNDCLIEANLMDLLSQSPTLLCLTHVSNVTGSIYPVEKIIDLVRSKSPSTSILIDASQSAGAISLSPLQQADFIVFASHKHLHSLPGAAVLIAKKRLNPIIVGGTGSNSMAEESLNDDALFAEVGTPNFPAIHAMVDALEFAESQLPQLKKQEDLLTAKLIEGVSRIEGLKLLGKQSLKERVGIIALQPEFGSAELHWASFLNTQNILVRGGLHCSPLHHQQLNLTRQGTLRLSIGWGSTEEHIEKAIHSLNEFGTIAKEVF